MKIGIDGRFWRASTGGIGRYTRSLLSNLLKIDRQNQYVVFITPADKKEFHLKAKNLKVVVADIGHYSLAEQTKLAKILGREKLDLIHFTNFNHPIFYRKPFVTTIHDLTMTFFPVGRKQKSAIRRHAYNAIMKHAAGKSRAVIAVSEATKKDIVKHLGGKADKIKVIYHGFDKVYHPQFATYEVAKKGPYILFVSQWRPHKGILKLLEAYKILKERYKIKEKLILVGKPNSAFPEINEAVEKSKSLEVETPGFVAEKDLTALYQNASAFVFPSVYEGFGLPILEAMACGAPVACSKTSSMPEVGGKAVLYFDPESPEDIAQTVWKILKNPKLKKGLISKGLKQAKKFSWEKSAREHLKIYEKAIEA